MAKFDNILGLAMAGASLLLCHGCADNSYPGEEYLSSALDPDPEHGAFPIRPSVGNSQLDEVVRGASVSSKANKTRDELSDTIYVYAYKRDMTTNYSSDSQTDEETCLLDGYMQDKPSAHGKRAMLLDEEPYITWTHEPLKVYFHDNNLAYDFFAYYLDGAYMPDKEISKTEDGIAMNLAIDGSNDIMTSKAVLTDEQLHAGAYTESDKEAIRNVSYSNITASWNIQPIFKFKHHLCRFVFYIFPKAHDVGNVYVEKISIKSRTKGVLTAVNRTTGKMGVDFSQEQEKQLIYLKEKDKSPLRKDVYHPLTDNINLANPPYVQVGADLILPPGEISYECEVTMKQEKNGVQALFYSTIILDNKGQQFEPGNQYNVNLGVYGAQEIVPHITVTPWVFGGTIEIDPDKDFGK